MDLNPNLLGRNNLAMVGITSDVLVVRVLLSFCSSSPSTPPFADDAML